MRQHQHSDFHAEQQTTAYRQRPHSEAGSTDSPLLPSAALATTCSTDVGVSNPVQPRVEGRSEPRPLGSTSDSDGTFYARDVVSAHSTLMTSTDTALMLHHQPQHRHLRNMPPQRIPTPEPLQSHRALLQQHQQLQRLRKRRNGATKMSGHGIRGTLPRPKQRGRAGRRVATAMAQRLLAVTSSDTGLNQTKHVMQALRVHAGYQVRQKSP